MNLVAISGNVTRDVEVRQASSGTSVLTFTLAVNDRVFNNESQEWEDKPNFITCVTFDKSGRRVPVFQQRAVKGAHVSVAGRLSQRSWEAKDGSKRSTVEVITTEVDFDRQPRSQAQQPAASANPYTGEVVQPAYTSNPVLPLQATDEDIPF